MADQRNKSRSGDAAKKRSSKPREAKTGLSDPVSQPWDPAASRGGPTLEEEQERQFHATHFTADPRGAGMSGAPPGARRKTRGGSPPTRSGGHEPAPRRKQRGGTGPE